MKKKVAIIGSGAFAQYIADYISNTDEYIFVGYIDRSINMDNNIIGTDNDLSCLFEKKVFDCVYIGIGYAQPDTKERIFKNCKNANIPLVSLIHPTAIIHPSVLLGEGIFVGPYSIIDSKSQIGNCSIIRSMVLIAHDDILENYTYIGDHSIVAGNVTIKEKCFLGVHSTIRNRLVIAEHTTIGCGANVVKSIEEGHHVYAGNPAKILPDKAILNSNI